MPELGRAKSRLFLGAALILSFAALSAVALTWKRSEVIREFEREAASLVERLQTDVDGVVRAGTEDLVLLAESPEARGTVSQKSGAASDLEALFTAYVLARRQVFQARLLAPDGREVLRIERSHAGKPVPATRLQDKASRYYFTQAQRLRRGEVFVSELDLNIEDGQLEHPLRPTLRFSTPLFTDAGQFAGVVVVNRSGEDLLDVVARSRAQVPGDLLLINAQGFYLSHPDAAKAWGAPHMLNTGARLEADHPLVWRWFSSETGDTATQRDGVVVARAAGPHPDGSPRVLLLTSVSRALAHSASDFIPLSLGLLAAALVLTATVLSLGRQAQLTAQVKREAALREAIAQRELRLRETQDRLVASARLATLSESAAALAHELRNPLGSIINSASLLQSGSEMAASDQALLGVVVSECQRLDRAVSEFLDLSRRPARRSESFDLAATVRQIVALATQDLGHDCSIHTDLEESALWLNADPDEIRQMLWNLLLNARAANRRVDGHKITVRAAHQTRDEQPGIALEVVDEGPGPPRPGAPPEPSASGTRGSGLGLIVVAGITAHYSGHFEITPGSAGHGACARVWIPAALPSSSSTSTGSAETGDHTSLWQAS